MMEERVNERKNRRIMIRTKLVLIYLLSSLVLLVTNVFVYLSLNKMINRIEEIYASNISINEMSNTLACVQSDMVDYLETKSSDSLESYFSNRQNFSNQLNELNSRIIDNDIAIMERTIVNLSNTYVDVTEKTIQAKRGRNTDGYVKGYEDSKRYFSYLRTMLYSLNTQRFQSNSQSYVELLSSMKYSEVICLSILVVVTLADLILIILLTRTITTPLIKLSKQAKAVAGGNLEIDLIEEKTSDEVGIVTSAFNQMVISLREYVVQLRERMETERALREKELKMDANLKEAQLKYLQAQINPHFLFNTLNAGAQLAMLEGADRTNSYIQRMADFFRYNVQKNNETVTIGQELELIDNYIYILNVRFAGDIHYTKEIDESLLDIPFPSMIVQPIVENSVNYGIRNIDWEGTITIELYREDNTAILCVSDNGIGMNQETVDKINRCEATQSSDYSDSNGVGLNNVISRLNLYYNREDVFTIMSEGANQGTRAYIRIPIECEDEVNR